MNNENTIIIIGAGASGLSASITLARKGHNVLLLEQNSRIGKKILVSGNGKCNIDNRYITPIRFHSSNPPFVKEFLKDYDFKEVENFFTSIGLPLVEGKDGKMFPFSLQASTVVNLLEYEAKSLGVQILCNSEVTNISKKDKIFTIETTKGLKKASKLIVASGSIAYPQLGGSNAGYMFATKMGHNLIPRQPSLVQLCSDENWIKECSGVKMNALVKFYSNNEYILEKTGDILFTNYGVSGLAILDISREVSLRISSFDYCELKLNLMPQFTKEQLNKLFLKNVNSKSNKPLNLWLQGFLPQKIIFTILSFAKCKASIEKQLNTKEISKIVYALQNLKLSISETKGFKHAEVASGGVDTTQIDPKTLESKLVKNLYFLGEVLDVDADRGGFNFHFAWVCGLKIT